MTQKTQECKGTHEKQMKYKIPMHPCTYIVWLHVQLNFAAKSPWNFGRKLAALISGLNIERSVPSINHHILKQVSCLLQQGLKGDPNSPEEMTEMTHQSAPAGSNIEQVSSPSQLLIDLIFIIYAYYCGFVAKSMNSNCLSVCMWGKWREGDEAFLGFKVLKALVLR